MNVMNKRSIIRVLTCLLAIITLTGCAKDSVNSDNETENTVSDSGSDSGNDIAVSENSDDNEETSEYVNLNFENTVYTLPELDEVVDLTYYMPYSGEEYEANEEKILANMEVMSGSSDYSYMKYWTKFGEEDVQPPDDGYYLLPYSVSAADIATEDKNLYYYQIYNDGEYSAMLYAGSNMYEMGDSKFWADLAGSLYFNIDYQMVYRPGFVSDMDFVAQYILPDDDIEGISYMLMDGEVMLEDAVESIESEMESYYFVRSDYIDFQVYKINVYQLSTGEYFYYCYLQGYIDDLPVSYDEGYVLAEDDETVELNLLGIRDHAAMIYSGKISYLWAQCGYEDAEVETVSSDEMISLDEACEIVSENLADTNVFNVTTVSMEYYVGSTYSYENAPNGTYWIDSRKIRLYYTFKINNPRVLGYTNVTFLVDAISGDFITYVE